MENKRLGILGGGQLGLLLCQAAMRFPVQVSVYDPNPECSAAGFTDHFVQGGFDDFEKIVEFGLQHDAVIFEIEEFNTEALLELKKRGVHVVSSPETLQWIGDKGIQKEKIESIGVPTSHFTYVDADQVKQYDGPFPIVQKWRCDGRDGQGVMIHKDKASLANADEVDSIFEEPVDIDKEIGVLVARNSAGEIVVYPPVEMVFDPVKNLVDYLIAPARMTEDKTNEMLAIAKTMAEKLEFEGMYAIEFFIDKSDKVYVNEISPRTHNSGHHTVAGNVTSQYEQQVRIALSLPLGSPDEIYPCIMLNLLADDTTGDTHYEGADEAFAIPNVQYTFYGKKQVQPGRKMGHAIILEKTLEKGLQRMDDVREKLKITTA